MAGPAMPPAPGEPAVRVRPCFQQTCSGLVSFVSARSKEPGQPARVWAECPACDLLQYLDEEGGQGPATPARPATADRSS